MFGFNMIYFLCRYFPVDTNAKTHDKIETWQAFRSRWEFRRKINYRPKLVNFNFRYSKQKVDSDLLIYSQIKLTVKFTPHLLLQKKTVSRERIYGVCILFTFPFESFCASMPTSVLTCSSRECIQKTRNTKTLSKMSIYRKTNTLSIARFAASIDNHYH